MLETDAPFLLPPGYKSARKGRNEPAALVEVARLVGEVLSLSVERVASDAYESTVRFFGIPPEVALLS
jgi:Tat protein secretion system quality control protein TatD with DNase activity